MKSSLKILMLEDIPDDAGLVERALRKEKIHFTCQRVDKRNDFVYALEHFKPDVVLSDHSLPQFNSQEALKICRQIYPQLPFILVTGAVSEEFAVKMLKDGADDYILKSNLSRLGSSVMNALKQRRMQMKKIRAEKALQKQNLELMKLNKELDNFVYSISHDLRAPLTSVLGLINLACMERQNQQAIDEYLQKMRQSVGKLDNTLKEILEYSRNTRVKIRAEKIDLATLIDECFEKLRYIDSYDKIDKKIRIHGDVDFYSDPYRVAIILSNLISNSVKYLDMSKDYNFIEIIVNVSDAVSIIFTDNGIGIQEEYLGQVFDMFYRATERSQGAGLGLYIVKEALEKLKGSISVESVSGKWTRFNVNIPNNIETPQNPSQSTDTDLEIVQRYTPNMLPDVS